MRGRGARHLKMRFHPQSPFGKAWAAHYAANNLASLSDDEKRAAYDRFCTEWAAAPRKL